ncbi:phosphopantetheine-binding protein [Williamsia sp. 1135]|uniref:phosphopantetheine-binding protein n=1 Tax=Williamsia sp. 1135 TaxID=1889262 RepID=UPI001F0B306F|nr:phosphopantetheine-binding protein [Williamsia sp. 1135]
MSQQNAQATLSKEQVVADIAAALGIPPEELAEDTDLIDAGLDSIRLMSLVEKWRSAGAADVDFPVLASEPVVGHWVEVLVNEPNTEVGKAMS